MKARNKLLIGVTAVMLAAAPSAFAKSAGAPTPTGNGNLTFDTTPTDHARLREIFRKDRSAENVRHAGFSLSAGAVVPTSVRLAPLPQTVINIQPTWQGSEYFRVGQRVVIVDPGSKKIEGVITL